MGAVSGEGRSYMPQDTRHVTKTASNVGIVVFVEMKAVREGLQALLYGRITAVF